MSADAVVSAKFVTIVVLCLGMSAAAGGLGVYAVTRTDDGGDARKPSGDIVVGVLKKCNLAAPNVLQELTGRLCDGGDRQVAQARIVQKSLQLTIRTPQGSTYDVEVPPDTVVNVGDGWPR